MRSSTSIISSPSSPESPGIALRARAAGGQVATPERYRALMRFKLWQQAKEHGVEHHESPEDIAAEFRIHPSLLWQWNTRESRPGGLRTKDRTGRPEEWNEEATEAMAAAIRTRRKGPNKKSQAAKRLRADMAAEGVVNPRTKKPYSKRTISRHRKAAGFRARLRRKRPALDKDLMKMRLQWAKDHKDRRWIACRDGGIARVFLDEWWAKSHAGRFHIWRCDDSDSEDDYDWTGRTRTPTTLIATQCGKSLSMASSHTFPSPLCGLPTGATQTRRTRDSLATSPPRPAMAPRGRPPVRGTKLSLSWMLSLPQRMMTRPMTPLTRGSRLVAPVETNGFVISTFRIFSPPIYRLLARMNSRGATAQQGGRLSLGQKMCNADVSIRLPR